MLINFSVKEQKRKTRTKRPTSVMTVFDTYKTVALANLDISIEHAVGRYGDAENSPSPFEVAEKSSNWKIVEGALPNTRTETIGGKPVTEELTYTKQQLIDNLKNEKVEVWLKVAQTQLEIGSGATQKERKKPIFKGTELVVALRDIRKAVERSRKDDNGLGSKIWEIGYEASARKATISEYYPELDMWIAPGEFPEDASSEDDE